MVENLVEPKAESLAVKRVALSVHYLAARSADYLAAWTVVQ